jgi:D-alanyl-D-alanine carboxypeptidase
MNSYKGMDGLKTGYINASGFNLAASATRDNQRIIGVVFGGRTGRSRNAHMKTLLDRGFKKLGRILIAAKNAPIPQKKPVFILASLDQIEPASGKQKDQVRAAENKFADIKPVLKSASFAELMGQGDVDPALARRYEVGMISISALKNFPHYKKKKLSNKKAPYKTQPLIPAKFKDEIGWSIQIGAFTSKDKTKTAIIKALKKLPKDFMNTSAAIVPLKTKEGRLLYRGRLKGLTKEQAIQACQYLRDCLLISPHTY